MQDPTIKETNGDNFQLDNDPGTGQDTHDNARGEKEYLIVIRVIEKIPVKAANKDLALDQVKEMKLCEFLNEENTTFIG